MSSSHVGLQTKQDLPLDDAHFSSFDTTASESFKNPGAPRVAQKVVDGRQSHFCLGDSSQNSYSTTQETSFIKHASSAYEKNARKWTVKKNFVLGQDPKSDVQSRYDTTSNLAFSNPISPIQLNSSPKHSEQSSIFLGNEHTERIDTGKSVTKSDYIQKEFIPIDIIPPQISGIIKVLAPTTTSEHKYETSASSSFRPPEIASRPKKEVFYPLESKTSAVPSGDCNHYNFSNAKSTSSDAYNGLNHGFPTHPKLGAQLTISNIILECPDYNYIESYVSTSQEAFQKYSKSQILSSQGAMLSPYVSSNIPQTENGQIPISTTRSHYLAPLISTRTKPIIPAASSNLVNPRGGEEASFETTSQQYYNSRPGIAGREISKIIQKGGAESCIMLGDRNHFYYEKSKLKSLKT
jgi:hypothetical protein